MAHCACSTSSPHTTGLDETTTTTTTVYNATTFIIQSDHASTWHHHALFTNLLRYTRPPFFYAPVTLRGRSSLLYTSPFFCGLRTLAPLTLFTPVCSNFTDGPMCSLQYLDGLHSCLLPSLWAIAIAVAHPITAYTHIPLHT